MSNTENKSENAIKLSVDVIIPMHIKIAMFLWIWALVSFIIVYCAIKGATPDVYGLIDQQSEKLSRFVCNNFKVKVRYA